MVPDQEAGRNHQQAQYLHFRNSGKQLEETGSDHEGDSSLGCPVETVDIRNGVRSQDQLQGKRDACSPREVEVEGDSPWEQNIRRAPAVEADRGEFLDDAQEAQIYQAEAHDGHKVAGHSRPARLEDRCKQGDTQDHVRSQGSTDERHCEEDREGQTGRDSHVDRYNLRIPEQGGTTEEAALQGERREDSSHVRHAEAHPSEDQDNHNHTFHRRGICLIHNHRAVLEGNHEEAAGVEGSPAGVHQKFCLAKSLPSGGLTGWW